LERRKKRHHLDKLVFVSRTNVSIYAIEKNYAKYSEKY
jgi:hypothetical protein